MKIRGFASLSILTLAGVFNTGCATYRSVETAQPYAPKVFSGTRIDYCAMVENWVCLDAFDTEPPRYPLLDLPASVLLDTLLLPATLILPSR